MFEELTRSKGGDEHPAGYLQSSSRVWDGDEEGEAGADFSEGWEHLVSYRYPSGGVSG